MFTFLRELSKKKTVFTLITASSTILMISFPMRPTMVHLVLNLMHTNNPQKHKKTFHIFLYILNSPIPIKFHKLLHESKRKFKKLLLSLNRNTISFVYFEITTSALWNYPEKNSHTFHHIYRCLRLKKKLGLLFTHQR